jgi:hypothetical protein
MAYLHEAMSPEALANLCENISPWCKEHTQPLSLELGTQRGLDKEALNHASLLRSSQQAYDREQLEDKAVVTEQGQLVHRAHLLIRSIYSGSKRRLMRHPEKERILADLEVKGLSKIRTAKGMSEALSNVSNALSIYKTELQAAPDRTGEWSSNLESLKQALAHNKHNRTRETIETRQSKDVRDEARENALFFLEEVELAAGSVELTHPDLILSYQQIVQRLLTT